MHAPAGLSNDPPTLFGQTKLTVMTYLAQMRRYYFENENQMITSKYISGLIALINEHIDNMDQSEQRAEVEAHYRNTLDHIRGMQEHPKTADKFASIALTAEKS